MNKRFKHDGGYNTRMKKSFTLMASLILVFAISVVGTVALLIDESDEVKNTFTPSTPDIKIEETLEDGVKKDVKVTNDGEVDMYVRVALVVTWKNADGNVIAQPEGTELTGVPAGNVGKWKLVDDYWYYTEIVAAGSTTDSLIDEAKATGLTDGVTVDLTVLAQGIQAEPDQAVIDAWGVEAAKAVGAIQ